ncbi:uncharacterized protein UTRI_04810_B [Ustilago trichophora]|uniref:Uncharacterized protein n=1 Tax=Ustilago trichophora TaxID=86804 RepID=A0A5C3EGR4_9BASI|nr:uncharacterized protein UTRI_04810_B [Ustilago trichophora]
MSQCAPAHDEAGPSTGSSRYDPIVRRSQTFSYTSSSSTHSRPHTAAATSLHQQLALPIQLNSSARRSSNAISELRDPTVSPSKRGETLRAYSRQRRVFSGNDNGAPTSPEQLTRGLPTPGPASPSMRRPHPSRIYAGAAGTSDSPGSSLLFSSGSEDTDSVSISPMLTNQPLEALGDEASSSMSSTPSLTSPTSTLSRSTSLRSAGSERNTLMGGTRYLSLNGSADLPTTMEALSPEYGTSNWTRRARRWSNSMSRRMSITALNQTIHSTTSPYLKAGLQELRSIFDVDTLGVAVDDHDHESDLEGASPAERRNFQPKEQDRLGLFAASAAAVSREGAVFESPEAISPILSRQSSSEDRELPTQVPASRPNISFKSQIYEAPVAHRRAQSWRKHRSLSISDLPNRSLLTSAANNTNSNMEQSSSSTFSTVRDGSVRSQPVRTPLVAVGLAALSVSIIGVCAFETSIHPDAASLPLTAFMLAQSVFALVGIAGLALQKRWVIDLASRLIRAHVLCQVLTALAALRSLSRTAFYRDRLERQSFNGTVAAGVLTSPRFLSTAEHVDPHMSMVGSFRDQVTYVCVFVVQAALPLAFVFWAQYTVASALSRATRHLPPSSSTNKHHLEQRQQSVPIVKVASADAFGAPRNERMRFNSENPSVSKASSFSTLAGANQRSEGWLGFVITRLDVNNTVSNPPPKFELDAAELTNRLQTLARIETPTQRAA